MHNNQKANEIISSPHLSITIKAEPISNILTNEVIPKLYMY